MSNLVWFDSRDAADECQHECSEKPQSQRSSRGPGSDIPEILSQNCRLQPGRLSETLIL